MSSYPIADIGTDADEAKRLRAFRIRTSERLLEAAKDPKGRQQLSEDTGIPPKRLLCLANCADRMRIKGMGKEYAAILPAVRSNAKPPSASSKIRSTSIRWTWLESCGSASGLRSPVRVVPSNE